MVDEVEKVEPTPEQREKWRKTGQRSRRKGATGELEVARMLQKWWEPVEVAEFKRTPASGGWGRATTRGGFKVAGDVCTSATTWPFTVEVKRNEGWAFTTLCQGKRCKVWDWWRQCLAAAAEENRIPLLVFRRNEQPWLVLAPELLLTPILLANHLEPDVVFGRLAPGVDDGDIRPVCIVASKFLRVPPHAFVRRRQKKSSPNASV